MYIIRVQSTRLSVYTTRVKTHIELDDALLEQVFELGGFATKKAAVNTALAEYAKLLKRRELLEMRGKVPWEGDLNEMRTDRRGRR
jgi:Arc/MetJ family transcription regulator